MIWVVDKKVVPHLLTTENRLAEVPLRISFEYAVEAGVVVDGSLSIKVLYNGRSIDRLPDVEADAFDADVEQTASEAVCEHLAMSGLTTPTTPAQAVVVGAR